MSDANRLTEPIATDCEVIDEVVEIREEPHAFAYELQHIKHGSRVWMCDAVMEKHHAVYYMIRRSHVKLQYPQDDFSASYAVREEYSAND